MLIREQIEALLDDCDILSCQKAIGLRRNLSNVGF